MIDIIQIYSMPVLEKITQYKLEHIYKRELCNAIDYKII